MNLNHATNKETGSTLSATEWNNLAADVNELGAGGANSGSSEFLTLSAKNNVELSSPKNINIEPAYDSVNNTFGDISLKPGDDIEFLSEHRPIDKQDEVSLKVHNGDKKPVKLQINASEFTLTTKDKEGNDANVLDVNVNSGKNSKGYLKVRAQAIDLRCEDHGGIALQPKGEDSDHNQNKIKFEHGGGDGLEFGTFNTEKTSLFTKEYRFNKDGKVLLATRTTQVSDKADANDPTTAYKYVKQADDFYDVIYEGESGSEFYNYDPTDTADTSVTWGDIVEFIAWAKANNEGPWASQL